MRCKMALHSMLSEFLQGVLHVTPKFHIGTGKTGYACTHNAPNHTMICLPDSRVRVAPQTLNTYSSNSDHITTLLI